MLLEQKRWEVELPGKKKGISTNFTSNWLHNFSFFHQYFWFLSQSFLVFPRSSFFDSWCCIFNNFCNCIQLITPICFITFKKLFFFSLNWTSQSFSLFFYFFVQQNNLSKLFVFLKMLVLVSTFLKSEFYCLYVSAFVSSVPLAFSSETSFSRSSLLVLSVLSANIAPFDLPEPFL